jgi:hypothetical protein
VTIPNKWRIDRGRRTAQAVAAALRSAGLTHAEAVTGAMTGQDITGAPGLSIEVKATAGNPNPAALRQARANARDDDICLTVWRPNGSGPATLDDWVVSLTFADAVRLLTDGGYIPRRGAVS